MTELNTITAQRGHVQALAFAAKGGSALSALLGSIATRKEEERRGPIEGMLFLETHFSDEEAVAIPVVGSKMGETGNKPYDKYTSEVQTKDGKKKVPGSWFTDVVKATSEYGAISNRIQWCDDITFETDDGQKCPADIEGMGTGERGVERERLRQRVKDMRTALTKSAMLFHHVREIAELNPDNIRVKLPIRTRKNAQGEAVQEVYGNYIRLQDPTGEKEDVSLTVSQFNALRPAKLPTCPPMKDNPDKLDKSGWTVTALEKTAERAPKTAKQKGKGKQEIAIPTTVEGVLNLMNILGTALDMETDQGSKTNAALLTALANQGKEGDDKVITVGDCAIKIDNLWTVIHGRYTALKAHEASVSKAATQARIAAAS